MSTYEVHDAYIAGAAGVARMVTESTLKNPCAEGKASRTGMQQVDLFNESQMTPKHDPGGKVRLTLPDGTIGTALFGGPSHEYRYRL